MIWRRVNYRRFLAVILMMAMLLNICPMTVFAEVVDESSENEGWVTEEIEFELDPVETSATPIGMFSISDGVVNLKSGNYEQWIDRIDLTEAGAIYDFYNVLVEASDNDGVDDFLINDTYFSGSSYAITVATVTGKAASAETLEQEMHAVANAYFSYAAAAFEAFDRDHPEVFWLTGASSYGATLKMNAEPLSYTVTIEFNLLTDEGFDIRSANYQSSESIKAGIKSKDAAVQTILNQVTTLGTVEKIKRFNSILTECNEYNTSDDLDTIDNDCRECISALVGKTGTEGPVCEAYARAFKVLCDASDIPCVLVDGTAISSSGSGPHMWNYVKVGPKWFGVDVTWNDPTGGASGAVSGYETDKWLLVGADTDINGKTFLTSHPVKNQVSSTGIAFTNGPVLHESKYQEPTALQFSQLPTVAGTYGQKVKDMIVSGPATSDNGATGVWTMEASDDIPEVGTTQAYRVIFTPDSEDYAVYEVDVVPTILQAEMPAVVPDNEITMGHLVENLSDVTLPENWVWDDMYEDYAVAIGGAVDAVAIYVGEDAANYKTTTQAVRVIRAGLTKTEKVEATTEAKGREAYWTCSLCGKHFSDAEGTKEVKDLTSLDIPQVEAPEEEETTGEPTTTEATTAETTADTTAELPTTETTVEEPTTAEPTTEEDTTFEEEEDEKPQALPKGTKITKGKLVYKVTKSSVKNGTVEFVKTASKSLKTISIPASITKDGIVYKVTSIAKNALKNNKKVTTLIVGKNVKTIGVNAFYGCKKLKTISILTTKLTKKTVGKNAFKGIYSKATIKVPKKKYKTYVSMLRTRGVGKKAKFKKV